MRCSGAGERNRVCGRKVTEDLDQRYVMNLVIYANVGRLFCRLILSAQSALQMSPRDKREGI